MNYYHDRIYHPLSDSERIMPLILDVVKPKKVVDVGCGIGTFLNTCKKLGVKEILGLDGDWVDRGLLSEHLSMGEFQSIDLRKPLHFQENYDLALCLEVAEHLEEEYAGNLVETLTSLSDVILFSAAIPCQEGQNHVNEQWPEYWAELFAEKNYIFADVIRPSIWDDKNISYWYRQNSFLVIKREKINLVESYPLNWMDKRKTPLRLVHPDLFAERAIQFRKKETDFFSGALKTRSYLYLAGKALADKFK